MRTGRWLAILVGTLIWSIALWFGLISLSASRTTALAVIAVGMVFSLYALAGFSGVHDPATTGFRASLVALGTALACILLFWGTGLDTFAIVAPIFGAGVGAALALGPEIQPARIGFRIVGVAIVAFAFTWVYRVDHNVYGMLIPIVTYPIVGVADRFFDRAQEVAAETDPAS
ncbi:MAG: hypothetical protein ACR2N2_12320 [Acidimicrobiia bacterium]